jgi:enterochelin esterase-like enzyme
MKFYHQVLIGIVLGLISLNVYRCVQAKPSIQAIAALKQATPSVAPTAAPQPAIAPTTNALTYQLATYDSAVMGGPRTYGVVLPPGYDQHPEQRYPVIFLLHGGHGDPTAWIEKGKAIANLEQLYDQGKLPPSIVITPDGNDKRGSSPHWDPQYIDGPNGNVSTAIGEELVSVVRDRYRTLPNPDFWAIGGLSSGGWGAINVGLHHTNHFSVLFSHSGYFEDKSGPENSPLTFIRTLPASTLQRLRIYLDTGDSDHRFLQQNQQFHQVLNQLRVNNTFNTFPGVHSWRFWREHLADSLTFVGEQFKIAQLAHRSDRNATR